MTPTYRPIIRIIAVSLLAVYVIPVRRARPIVADKPGKTPTIIPRNMAKAERSILKGVTKSTIALKNMLNSIIYGSLPEKKPDGKNRTYHTVEKIHNDYGIRNTDHDKGQRLPCLENKKGNKHINNGCRNKREFPDQEKGIRKQKKKLQQGCLGFFFGETAFKNLKIFPHPYAAAVSISIDNYVNYTD